MMKALKKRLYLSRHPYGYFTAVPLIRYYWRSHPNGHVAKSCLNNDKKS